METSLLGRLVQYEGKKYVVVGVGFGSDRWFISRTARLGLR